MRLRSPVHREYAAPHGFPQDRDFNGNKSVATRVMETVSTQYGASTHFGFFNLTLFGLIQYVLLAV